MERPATVLPAVAAAVLLVRVAQAVPAAILQPALLEQEVVQQGAVAAVVVPLGILAHLPVAVAAALSAAAAPVMLVVRVVPGKSALRTTLQRLEHLLHRAVLPGQHPLASLRLASRRGVVAEAVGLTHHLHPVVRAVVAAAHTP
jgi:hypothetical protein